ncbi:PREDICTED: interferon-inducible GTPase 1-like [Chinchilla lanigera]|uniref:Interferon-inducible GTPase 1-like n=1 Tax=Chinchilla lanigera TaxID=34839 RepID=A0A8C2W5X6_CHILA|nr:PREDICTED: interferon-inducible GTPase 1-like [Chinchilla lanigera]XP_013363589.1 PREDICTED: interferon-inducible GTPase 1-like [Chinchilla lanigera]
MDALTSAFLKNLTQKNFQQLAADFLPQYSALISKAGGIISPETLDGIQAALREGNLQAVVDTIQEVLSAAENAALEVAVIGESGTGKSSFINALRGLGHEEEGAAEVGVVETTMKKTPYQHPKYPNVTFWDLPGTGTPKFTPDTYLETVGFASFDFFIIISCSRFTLNDAVLAQKIKETGKKFYFVRSKVDNDLYNEQKTKPQSFKRKRVLQQIRDYCLANLRGVGVPDPRIFLVSNFDLCDFDFPHLERTLLEELPAHKRQVFTLILPTLSDASIELKRGFLREKIWLDTLKASTLAFIPFAPILKGFDLPEQEECLRLYRNYFGLDDKSIEEIAKKLGTSVQDIKGFTRCLDFWSLVKDDSIAAKAMHCAESFFSVNGGALSVAFQFMKIYFLRLNFLDIVSGDAKLLLHKTITAHNSESEIKESCLA